MFICARRRKKERALSYVDVMVTGGGEQGEKRSEGSGVEVGLRQLAAQKRLQDLSLPSAMWRG
jgi:hypothetical protein